MKRFLTLILAIVLCTNLLIGCTKNKTSENLTEITLYFANGDKNNLTEESRLIELKDKEKLEVRLVRELLDGPRMQSNKAVIPEGTKLLGLNIKNGTATIDLSSDYYDYKDADNKDALELLARYSIVSTLCTLPRVNKVLILIDSMPLINSSGNQVGEISINDILSGKGAETSKASKFVTLYFSDKSANKLVMERRRVDISDNTVEKMIVTELIKGTVSEDSVNLIPKDTKVLSVETKEGICFVNLSDDFIKKYTGGNAGVLLCIYSIVNSLTELDEIEKVQFLIEGSKTELFNEVVFSEAFIRDEALIDTKN